MPKAFYCIPSARPIADVLPVVSAWRERGYGVALWRDDPLSPNNGIAYAVDTHEFDFGFGGFGADLMFVSHQYPGYAKVVNAMAEHVLRTHLEVDWVVAGGDDTYPDPNKTGDEIADDCSRYFGGEPSIIGETEESIDIFMPYGTFGVMQPTGDDWRDGQGRIIERIAGSPWLGREWCRRAHGGLGPLWPEFTHMFGDESLQLYAQSLGVFLQRPDLTHFHAHAQRDGSSPPAPHMGRWNSRKHWMDSEAIFKRLKSTNFAECQPIA